MATELQDAMAKLEKAAVSAGSFEAVMAEAARLGVNIDPALVKSMMKNLDDKGGQAVPEEQRAEIVAAAMAKADAGVTTDGKSRAAMQIDGQSVERSADKIRQEQLQQEGKQ